MRTAAALLGAVSALSVGIAAYDDIVYNAGQFAVNANDQPFLNAYGVDWYFRASDGQFFANYAPDNEVLWSNNVSPGSCEDDPGQCGLGFGDDGNLVVYVCCAFDSIVWLGLTCLQYYGQAVWQSGTSAPGGSLHFHDTEPQGIYLITIHASNDDGVWSPTAAAGSPSGDPEPQPPSGPGPGNG